MKKTAIVLFALIWTLTIFTLLVDFAKGAECYRSAYYDVNRNVLIVDCCEDYHFDPDIGAYITLKNRIDNPTPELLKMSIESMCVVLEKVI